MLRVTNTLTRSVEPVSPLEPGRVKMYSCGPTVYRPLHIGNLRTFILADVVRRVLAYHGLDVTAVMNLTDVGHMTDELTGQGRDRMMLAAADEDLTTAEIAEKYTQLFFDHSAACNIIAFDHYPKATDHIEQMIELNAKLIERGHAYEAEGNVYYDVTTFPDYGRLSGQSLEDMQAGHRHDHVDPVKRHHQDFLLWRSAGDRRELVFDSPWGTGYPGWHIECSAMSMHLLGDRFDIHTGGVDNVFPHHEDEIAQSEGAVGHRVVSTWIHGDHLLLGRAKMAKSAGNVVTIDTVVQAGHDPIAFRYLCFTARYRRQVHFADEALDAASTALRRLRERVATLGTGEAGPATDAVVRTGLATPALAHHERFMDAIEDDLDLPEALTVLHAMLGDDGVSASDRRRLALSWDHILGLRLAGDETLEAGLTALIDEREQARSAKDFAKADALRERLREAGVELIDTPDGVRWVRR